MSVCPPDIAQTEKTPADVAHVEDIGGNVIEGGSGTLGGIFAEYEDIGGNFKLGDDSDDEHARNRFGDIGTEDVLRKMNDRLGDTRYWAFVDKKTGRIFSRWRGQELEPHQKKAAEVDRIFKKHGRARMKWSFSETINRWGLKEGISKLVIGQN